MIQFKRMSRQSGMYSPMSLRSGGESATEGHEFSRKRMQHMESMDFEEVESVMWRKVFASTLMCAFL